MLHFRLFSSHLTPQLSSHRVHIRRTDKVGTEAAFHSVAEYMTAVDDFYDQLELRQPVDKRRVYIASDDYKVRDISHTLPNEFLNVPISGYFWITKGNSKRASSQTVSH